MKSHKQKILVDSNVFVALFVKEDTLHQKALAKASVIDSNQYTLATNTLVVAEVMTILAFKTKAFGTGRQFWEHLEKGIQKLPLHNSFEEAAYKRFIKQKRVALSFVDCYLLEQAKQTQSIIFTFDEGFRNQGVALF